MISHKLIVKEMGRSSQVPVCAECTQRCRLSHRKEKSSLLLPTSFFKIMVGQDFSKHMYIPPKFNHTVPASALLEKKITLKDSRGEQWEVTVSRVDDFVAFKEGWNAFSLDHGLKIGDFLIFNYISELQFDVLIYDESACEKLDFSKKRNQKKRSRDESSSSFRDGLLVRHGSMKSHCREVDLGGTQNNTERFSNYDNSNSNVRAQSVHIAEHLEDPCYKTSRDFGNTERDDKISMFVLDCEILNNCGGYGIGQIPSLGQKDKSAYHKSCTLKLEENRENNSIMSNRKVREYQFADGLESEQVVISQNTHTSHIDDFCNTNQIFSGIQSNWDTINTSEMLKVTEKKLVDMTPNVSSFEDKFNAKGQMSKLVKKESVDKMTPTVYKYELPAAGEASKRIKSELQDMTLNGCKDELLLARGLSKSIKREPGQSLQPFNEDKKSRSQTAANVSCVVPTDDNSFLELPAPLPLSNKKGMKMERLVVYLQDRLMRLWPVFYHEGSNFYALTEGWSEFCKANNIQPRDVCIFVSEDKSNRIIVVDVDHK